MNSVFAIHELSIVLLTNHQNPTLLNFDFLKDTGIVYKDWELSNEPISTPNLAQINFQNGLRIIADTKRIIFTEKIADKSLNDLVVAQVAKRYTQVLPHAEYQALGINPEGFATFPAHPEIAQTYLAKTILFSQPWLEFGNASPNIDLNISYTLDHGTLNLKVSQGFLRQEQAESSTPIMVFASNFEYIFQQVSPSERLALLSNYLEQWQLNLETFTNLIKNQFLQSSNAALLGVNTDSLIGQPIEITLR